MALEAISPIGHGCKRVAVGYDEAEWPKLSLWDAFYSDVVASMMPACAEYALCHRLLSNRLPSNRLPSNRRANKRHSLHLLRPVLPRVVVGNNTTRRDIARRVRGQTESSLSALGLWCSLSSSWSCSPCKCCR